MKTGPFTIKVAGGDVTAIAYVPPSPSALGSTASATLVLAHGAGAGQLHPYMVGTAERLRARGVSVVTFDFPYVQNGRKLPDKAALLEACFRGVFDAVRDESSKLGLANGAPTALFAGGKSMGGRIASQAAAKEEVDPTGLVFLGYPLHPPGKPNQLRDEHLPRVRAPMLFVQGTRDAFGTAEELRPLVRRLHDSGKAGSAGDATRTRARATLYEVDGGDHSHVVPKRGPAPQEDVLGAIADAIVGWMQQVSDTPAQNARS